MADKYNCPNCDKKVGKIGLCPRCAEIDYAPKLKPIEKPKKKPKMMPETKKASKK